jgi:hypothetical protein
MTKENLTINQKLVATCILMPFLADTIEDLLSNTKLRKDLFDEHLVKNMKTLMKKLRAKDNILIGSASIQAIDQQSEMYIALKQWLIENLIITE